MKILLTITGLAMGGAEHVVVNLADTLVARGHQVKIAYLTGEALVLPKNKNIEVVAIGMQEKTDFLSAYFKLRALVKAFQPDVVHSHMVHANLISRLLRLTVKIPKLVCTAHSNNEGGQLRMLAYRITDKLADISTNVSQDAVNEFVAKGAVKPGRMLAIANGIDVNTFSYNSHARDTIRNELGISDKKMLLAVGRLDVPKDYPNLLHAIERLAQQRDDFKVFIAGDGPLRSELAALVKTMNIEDMVEFLGIRRDVRELMSATDMYIMSSAWEGLPMVILEAMACERLIITTDCGGVSEAIGSSGFLVPPKNSNALADALNSGLSLDESECAEISKAARQRVVERFSLDANVDAFLKLYSK